MTFFFFPRATLCVRVSVLGFLFFPRALGFLYFSRNRPLGFFFFFGGGAGEHMFPMMSLIIEDTFLVKTTRSFFEQKHQCSS